MKLKQIIETTAPTAPPAPVKTPPRPKPDFNPFAPTKPKDLPKPKAKKKRIVEGFDDEAHSSVVDFWRNIRRNEHPYAKHPIMAMYGHESASKSFDNSIERVKKAFPQLSGYDVGYSASSIVQRVMRLERRYAKQLEEIAIDVVSKTWNVPPELLQAKLTNSVSSKFDDHSDDVDDEDVDDREINKRITMNALTQGAAVHNMMTMHKLVESELNALDPRLLGAYDKIGPGTEHTYWLMDYSKLANLAGAAVGSSEVKYDDNNKPTVEANALIFPVLIQELVKGVMELLSHHGLSHLSKGQLRKVYKTADRLEDEPWLIQVGPQLWKNFLKVVPESSRLAETVAKIAMKDPDYIHNLLSRTIEAIHSDSSVDDIREELRELIDGVEEYSG